MRPVLLLAAAVVLAGCGGVGTRTVVEVAVLDRVPRGDLPADLDDFLARLRTGLPDEERS
jgi:hypothetical protein